MEEYRGSKTIGIESFKERVCEQTIFQMYDFIRSIVKGFPIISKDSDLTEDQIYLKYGVALWKKKDEIERVIKIMTQLEEYVDLLNKEESAYRDFPYVKRAWGSQIYMREKRKFIENLYKKKEDDFYEEAFGYAYQFKGIISECNIMARERDYV